MHFVPASADQGLPCVQVQPIFTNTAGNNMGGRLECGVLVEFEMTDNQVSLANQMKGSSSGNGKKKSTTTLHSSRRLQMEGCD